MATNSHTPRLSICLVTTLYLFQGINLGFIESIPLLLASHGITWKDRGTFTFAYYPFSMKLIWAPLVDSIYVKQFGRRKSWLVPIQLSMGALLLALSFFIESFIDDTRIIWLTVIFFSIVFLTATQDICVDGLAITLFHASRPQWASTSQIVGQTTGSFVGSSLLLTLESANFTNRFIRKPLSLSPEASGLFSVQQFVCFVAVTCLLITIYLLVFLREKEDISTTNGDEANHLFLTETYLSILKLFKKKCIRQLTLVLLLAPIGVVAFASMTDLELIK